MHYYIGLDLGTSSIGWAVTDTSYNLLRKKGKDLWGVRLFNEAQTASERRIFRTSRRRLQREQARIGYLKELFAPEIEKIDSSFYQRLEDSKYFKEDKTIQQPYAIFADTNFTDKDYYENYPTIFHLRKELLEETEPKDVRLVFLAILNLFKHRGHFLNSNLEGDNEIGNLAESYAMLIQMAEEVLDIEMHTVKDSQQLGQVLTNKDFSKSKKQEELLKLHGITKKNKQENEIWKFICGLEGNVTHLFSAEKLDLDKLEDKEKKFSFQSISFAETSEKLEGVLTTEQYDFLMLLKQIHDTALLMNIMKGYRYLSEARVAEYEKHKKDLQILKSLLKEEAPEEYHKMFRVMAKNNYSAYVKSVNSGKKTRREGTAKLEDFYKNIKKIVSALPDSDKKTYVLEELGKENFLPKQLTASNGAIPNQVHKKELVKILENASSYLPFLKEKDASGLTVSERIVQMFEFQIPYYVGPISNRMDGIEQSKNVWSVRKESGKVYPWNFEQKIDVKESAEKFIQRMVNHCTYLSGEQVLPKNSLMYERFMVLNELNNLKINEEKITVELKQALYQDLFLKGQKVTSKAVIKYLQTNGYCGKKEKVELSGIDGDFTNRLSSYQKFCDVFNTDSLTTNQEQIAEQVIFWATIYGDTKAFLKEKIIETYGDLLNEAQIKKICNMNFKDWGRLSKELLNIEGANIVTGEVKSVLNRMWEENYNLMELIASNNFTYIQAIEEKTMSIEKTLTEIEYEDLDDLYASAPVKRMIWQTILILKELYDVMGSEPTKIFIEMARSPEEVKTRKDSRKKKFQELYKKCKTEGRDWSKEIESLDESQFRRKKLYLYYTQQGRCMYTGESIALNDLFNDNLYDIDHIYPRHFVKDDSIERNLVLVKKDKNAHKSDSFPIEASIRQNQKKFWTLLRDGNFITEEKFKRLTRNTEFTQEEMANFISRQLVETRQGTKLITHLLEKTFETTDIVYVKAGNVSDFRHKYEMVKCRTVNDFHHAQDAYLNIVVGNVYNVKFTKNPLNFIKNEFSKNRKKNNYHLNRIFDFSVQRGNEIAWIADNGQSISTVRAVMNKNTPLVTKMNFEVHGGFADQTIYSAKKAASGQGYLPVKTSDEKLQDVSKYGGFTKFTGAYFFLVEYTNKGKRLRSIEPMPLYLKDRLNTKEKLETYCKDVLNYESPSVRYMKIKMYSLIKVNGYYLYLTGRAGNQLLVCNAVQMVLNNKQCLYIKTLTKVAEEKLSATAMKKLNVTKEQNQQLYAILVDKHLNRIYAKKPNPVGSKLHEWQETFEKLAIEDQVYVLLQILKLSQLMNQGADLKKIGGSNQTGISQVSKKITDKNEFKLIHQSPTGLYEQEIDLLRV